MYFFKIKFENILENLEVIGEGELSWYKNHLGSSSSQKDITKVKMYSKLKYNNIYKGIDLIFYINNGNLEYDFIINKEGSIEYIKMSFDGVESISFDEEENLLLKVNNEDITILKPESYQDILGVRNVVESNFILNENIITFEVGEYYKEYVLTIDPVLAYSTYFGAEGWDVFFGGMDIDAQNNAYGLGLVLTGEIFTNRPPLGPTGFDAILFLTKFNSSGQLVYSTLINGDYYPYGKLLAVSNDGYSYITAVCDLNTAQNMNAASNVIIGNDYNGICVMKISPDGFKIEYFIYISIPNSVDVIPTDITVDINGNAYVTGRCINAVDWSTVIPSSKYTALGGALVAAPLFVFKITLAGQLDYFTTLAGNNNILPGAISVDTSKNVYVASTNYSNNFGSISFNIIGSEGNYNSLILKLSSGKNIDYLTIIGGSADSFPSDIDIDAENNVYILGKTDSTDYPVVPTSNVIGGTPRGTFVSKLSSTGSYLIYSVRIRSSVSDMFFPKYIAVDELNQAHITGATQVIDYPMVNPIQGSAPGGINIYVSILNTLGNAFIFSTYIGGSVGQISTGIAVDSSNNTYVAGYTTSNNFPVVNAWQSIFGGSNDGILFKIKKDVTLDDIYDLLVDPVYGLEETKIEVRNIESILGNQSYGLLEISQRLTNIELQNQYVLGKLNEILAFVGYGSCFYYSTGIVKKEYPIEQIEIYIVNNDINYKKIIIEKKMLSSINKCNTECKQEIITLMIPGKKDKKLIYELKYPYFSISIKPADSNLDLEVYQISSSEKKKIDLIII